MVMDAAPSNMNNTTAEPPHCRPIQCSLHCAALYGTVSFVRIRVFNSSHRYFQKPVRVHLLRRYFAAAN